MYRVKQAVIVEGKYDKIKLSSIIDGLIIQTDGFHIFKNPEMRAMIKKIADVSGVIILTDSDAAGFRIRRYISSFVAPEKIIHAYVPDVYGKEKRKTSASKEGKLGVEGISADSIIAALEKVGALGETEARREKITKYDMYELGLSGKEGSSEKRAKVLKKLDLPEYVSTNALIDVVNVIMSPEDFRNFVAEL